MGIVVSRGPGLQTYLPHPADTRLWQNLLPVATETIPRGVTDRGVLVTHQPPLRISRRLPHGEIGEMSKMGPDRAHVEGAGQELRNSWVAPDGVGNHLLAIDLKPENVLRDTDGRPLLTDAVLTPITAEVVAGNRQLEKYAPQQLERQFGAA